MEAAKRITVIGVGLIGGSISLALKAKWPDIHITGCDTNKAVLQSALAAGVVDATVDYPKDGCAKADFIFIATPVSVIPQIIQKIAGVVEPNTIVTDVGSTKSHVVEAASEFLPADVNFIGGHPMAGSEQEGLGAASQSLLKEAVYVLTPTTETSPDAFQKLHALLTRLGARVMALSPEKHDEVVAAVSHLPHILASGLVNLVAAVEGDVENRLLFAAGGFRDMTRVASGSPDLWVEICLDNEEAISKSIDKFIRVLNDFKETISTKNRTKLHALLESARTQRASIALGEHVVAAHREIDIPVTDSPGTISRITLTFGQLGINIEDIQIVHTSDNTGVVKMVIADGPNVQKALDKLREHGFDIVDRQ